MRWARAGRRLWCVAFVAMANVALVGCARSWPTVDGIAAREFATEQRVVDAVDVMPLDVDFAVSSHAGAPAQEIMDRFQSVALGTIQTELQRRGYRVTVMDWNGNYTAPSGAPAFALEQQALVDTADSLRGYGFAQAKTHGELLYPYLPHRLGAATGSDTTLYVGGWAYVGKKRTSTGKKVATGVLIGAVVVIIIVAAIAGGKKGGGGLGGIAKGAGKVASSGAKTILRGAGTAARTVGKLATSATKVAVKAGPQMLETTARTTGRVAARTLDAFGRANIDTHIEIYGGQPEYYKRDLPHKGYSRMIMEMTLVDNASGKVLWHARQRFEADAQSGKDTARVMQLMLASLPATR